MQNNDFRAKQFMPFDALNGFNEARKIIERKKENKEDLSDDTINNLNTKIKQLKKNTNVIIKYYDGFNYIQTSGYIKKIDYINHDIYILNAKINFYDILDIEIKKE